MKFRKLKAGVTILVIGGSLALVFHPLDATEDDHLEQIEVDGPSALRTDPLEGDVWILNEAKGRQWSSVSGLIVEDLVTQDGQASRLQIAVWEDGYYFGAPSPGPMDSAEIGRVRVQRNPDNSIDIFDNRDAPCPPVSARNLGRTFVDKGGSVRHENGASFEPLGNELDDLTNDELTNWLIAPSYWIRSVIELHAERVDVTGSEAVAGRPAYVVRMPIRMSADDPSSLTETWWIDKERHVLLKRVREGKEYSDPNADKLSPFRQEWRFEEIAFDDSTHQLRLRDLPLSEGVTVNIYSGVENDEKSVTVGANASVASVLSQVGHRAEGDAGSACPG